MQSNEDQFMKNQSDKLGKSIATTFSTKSTFDYQKQTKPNTIGEIAIKSEALTDGYKNMPQLNGEVFKQNMFFTGDLGKQDIDGNIYITGRKKLFIDTGGYKVDPVEVEDILVTHSMIKEAVVIGVKSSTAGEIIKAVIVADSACQESDIRKFCKEKLAEYKIPKYIEFRDQIPKSPLGKILRKDLL